MSDINEDDARIAILHWVVNKVTSEQVFTLSQNSSIIAFFYPGNIPSQNKVS